MFLAPSIWKHFVYINSACALSLQAYLINMVWMCYKYLQLRNLSRSVVRQYTYDPDTEVCMSYTSSQQTVYTLHKQGGVYRNHPVILPIFLSIWFFNSTNNRYFSLLAFWVTRPCWCYYWWQTRNFIILIIVQLYGWNLIKQE